MLNNLQGSRSLYLPIHSVISFGRYVFTDCWVGFGNGSKLTSKSSRFNASEGGGKSVTSPGWFGESSANWVELRNSAKPFGFLQHVHKTNPKEMHRKQAADITHNSNLSSNPSLLVWVSVWHIETVTVSESWNHVTLFPLTWNIKRFC